jgi:lysophospholipase L1-like esterase
VARNRSNIANLQSFQFSTKNLVKIMPLGDSITQGFVSDSTWRYYLYQQLRNAGYGVDFVGSQHTLTDGYDPHLDYDQDHEGHSGWRADQVLAQISGWANATHPDVVLIHLGTNDLRAGQTPQSTINEIGQISDVLRSVNPNVKIVLAQIIRRGCARGFGRGVQLADPGAGKLEEHERITHRNGEPILWLQPQRR